MVTVAQVAKAALSRILVQPSEASLESDEYEDFIFALNNWMLELESDGVLLGYRQVTALGDDVTVPRGAIRGIIANLAIEVAPDYERPISPALGNAAEKGLETIYRLGQTLHEAQMPDTLPIGSGNDGDWIYDDPFYDEDDLLDDAIPVFGMLNLEGNATDTTISVAGTPVLVAGSWEVLGVFKFEATAAGRFTYVGDDDMDVTLSAHATISTTAGSDQILTLALAKNGTVIDDTKRSVTAVNGVATSVYLDWAMNLDGDDYLELFVANETNTNDVLVSDCAFRVDQK